MDLVMDVSEFIASDTSIVEDYDQGLADAFAVRLIPAKYG